MEETDIISSGLLELYVLGIASPEEVRQVAEWADQYPEVRAEIDKIEAAMESFAVGHAVTPPADIKQKITSTLFVDNGVKEPANIRSINEAERERSGNYSVSTFFKWAAAACFILLLGSLLLNYNYYNKYRRSNQQLETAQNQLREKSALAEAKSKEMDVITRRDALPVVLNGTPHSPNALAKIFWLRNSGEVYVDPSNLPQPPPGKQYQLWAIVDGKPVDGGMIPLEMGNIKIQKMKSFGSAEAFAITLEKEGGSPAPTMEEMVVISKI